jgi:hypothetical protein
MAHRVDNRPLAIKVTDWFVGAPGLILSRLGAAHNRRVANFEAGLNNNLIRRETAANTRLRRAEWVGRFAGSVVGALTVNPVTRRLGMATEADRPLVQTAVAERVTAEFTPIIKFHGRNAAGRIQADNMAARVRRFTEKRPTTLGPISGQPRFPHLY